MNKSTIIIISSVIILILLVLFVPAIINMFNGDTPDIDTDSDFDSNLVPSDSLYFIAKGKNGKFGVVKSNGEIVIEKEYDKISRIEDVVYAKNKNESFIFNLSTKTKTLLLNKETAYINVINNQDMLMPYFILKYEEKLDNRDDVSDIYSIYNLDGSYYSSRDYVSYSQAVKSMNILDTKSIPEFGNSDYNIKQAISFTSVENKYQYIYYVKKARVTYYGVIDSSGKILVNAEYDKYILNSTGIIFTKTSAAVNSGTKDRYGNIIYTTNELEQPIVKNYTMTSTLFDVDSGFSFKMNKNYVLQVKGNTLNKVYNKNGQSVFRGAYSLNEDLVGFNNFNNETSILLQNNEEYLLFNLINNKVSEFKYQNIELDYIKTYAYNSQCVETSAFIYKKDDKYYAHDLLTKEEIELSMSSGIICPLDMGVMYDIKVKSK